MAKFNGQDVIINLELFRKLQFYQIFDSSEGIKIFRWNIHQLFFAVYAVISICIQSYGFSTSFSTKCNPISNIDYFLIIYTSINVYISCWKLFKCLNDRDRFLDLFKIMQFNFLTTTKCSKYGKVLYKHHDETKKFINYFLICAVVISIQWFSFPLVYNEIVNLENSNIRAKNIMNLCFGVTTKTYNHNIFIFYLIEIANALLILYFLTMFDVLSISLCSANVSQQRVLINAFNNIGYEDKPQISKIFKVFKHYKRKKH
uniref:Uncharacterized protein n=1 Tax=Schizaphis graminum TaxID=13262 RepID=A0A2S2NX35_SCHGA